MASAKGRAASLGFDVGRPDDFGPFLGFFSDEFSEIGERFHNHGAAQVGKAGLHPSVGEGGVDLLVKLGDDFSGCVLGRAEERGSTQAERRMESCADGVAPSGPPAGKPPTTAAPEVA